MSSLGIHNPLAPASDRSFQAMQISNRIVFFPARWVCFSCSMQLYYRSCVESRLSRHCYALVSAIVDRVVIITTMSKEMDESSLIYRRLWMVDVTSLRQPSFPPDTRVSIIRLRRYGAVKFGSGIYWRRRLREPKTRKETMVGVSNK